MSSIGGRSCEIIMKEKTPLSYMKSYDWYVFQCWLRQNKRNIGGDDTHHGMWSTLISDKRTVDQYVVFVKNDSKTLNKNGKGFIAQLLN